MEVAGRDRGRGPPRTQLDRADTRRTLVVTNAVGVPGPQLPVAAVTPTEHTAVARQCTRMVTAGGDPTCQLATRRG